MTNRSKAIGTAAETAVVRYLAAHGFPAAERRALHGATAAMGFHRVGLRLRVGVRAQHLAHVSKESGVGRVTTPTLA